MQKLVNFIILKLDKSTISESEIGLKMFGISEMAKKSRGISEMGSPLGSPLILPIEMHGIFNSVKCTCFVNSCKTITGCGDTVTAIADILRNNWKLIFIVTPSPERLPLSVLLGLRV